MDNELRINKDIMGIELKEGTIAVHIYDLTMWTILDKDAWILTGETSGNSKTLILI